MGVYKDKKRGTWRLDYYITDWDGKRKKTTKRGFKTKKEAQEYERVALLTTRSDLKMSFKDFFNMYEHDMKARLKLNTWMTKENIVFTKIMPYFENKSMCDIDVKDIIRWQNIMINYRNENGAPYSCVYLKTLNNQISSIFNHAVNVYNLSYNPVRKAGRMGSEKSQIEVAFWTKEEYLRFANYIADKPMSYYAFEMLYWCGLRLGEMLALTPSDFDFGRKTVKINKSYQYINGKNIITTPKTLKSNRTIVMPDFLAEEMEEFIRMQYKIKATDRIFTLSKTTLHKDMTRGSDKLGLKRIKLHALRHSHVSLLIERGFTPLAIADRVGHESISITYLYAHLFPNKQQEIANDLDDLRGEV